MIKIPLALSIVAPLFISQVYAQSAVLSCTVKEASGQFHPQVAVNTILEIPLDKLTAVGSKYQGDNIIDRRYTNENQNIIINRETGDFTFTSSRYDGFMLSSKLATGICENRKLKM
jgi:hypothetical protein